MIRLSANLSRKVPLPGIQFSSQQYGASMEIEVSDADTPEAIQARIRELYDLLSRSIDEQIAGTAAPGGSAPAPHAAVTPHAAAAPRAPRIPPANNRVARHSGGNGNGHGRGTRRNGQPVMATAAQKKAIGAICSDQGLDLAAVLADWDGDVERLTIKEASAVIDALKGAKSNGAHT